MEGGIMGIFNFFKKEQPSFEIPDIEEVGRNYVGLFKEFSKRLDSEGTNEQLSLIGAEITDFAGFDLACINFYLSENNAQNIKDEMAFYFIADRVSLYLMEVYIYLEDRLGDERGGELTATVFYSIITAISSATPIDQATLKSIKKLILETTESYALEKRKRSGLSSYGAAMCYKRIEYDGPYIVFRLQYEPIATVSSLFFNSLVLSKLTV
jgi:hypothetical protein